MIDDSADRSVEIMDTTLRDGSYATNFEFTVGQTERLCEALESAGVRFVEVGHGVGLNASNEGYGRAKATDEEYMEGAAAACEEANWGMFCIPDIARPEHVDLAARYGMDFIRIGTNVTEVEEAEEFVALAKSHDMFVAANFMKSYAKPPGELAAQAEKVEEYGADMVYLVDSAGGMLPETVREYYRVADEACGIPLGFHGHNNLGLAVANSLVTAHEGAMLIDTSLQGLGRSAGNAPTEMTVAVLEKAGFTTGVDLQAVLQAGHGFVHPIQANPTRMPLDVMAGFAEFHSSHMTKILDYANRYQVDPAALLLAVSQSDKVYAPEDVVERAAEQLDQVDRSQLDAYGSSIYPGEEE